tara:strand:+ start:2783 stop:3592 length:810 start_codon:yes stop_codon:yes gene_type:complete
MDQEEFRGAVLNQPKDQVCKLDDPPISPANYQHYCKRLGYNLSALLDQRFKFLQDHIETGNTVLEVGAGQGVTKTFLPGINLIQTDVHAAPWLDATTSAEALPFGDAVFDAVICIAALHHMNFPLRAIAELARVTRKGGKVLVLEPHNSWLLRQLLMLSGYEYVDEGVDPFGAEPCLRSEDNWDGNNAIGDLLFGDQKRLRESLPDLEIIHHEYSECLMFMNSGGVNHRTPYIPLPRMILNLILKIDKLLCRSAPNIFALVQEVVLQKT